MAKKGGKRHDAEQIVRKLRDAEALLSTGKTIGEACQALGVSEQTFHRWRKKYGGMKAEEAKRLEDLEQENSRLKKLVADLSLDVQMLKEIARGNF
jgi:putative transposase